MVIGVSKIIGIDLPENFNMPYLAVSPIDFWRRWHITLSSWLRDYLYFSLPLRRNRPWDAYRNTAITFLLSGLWHGAGWTFVCWGALHGVALSGSHWWAARRLRLGHLPSQSMGVRLICWLSTYVFICITWVLFRSQSLTAILTILRKMAGMAPGGIVWIYSPLLMVLPIVIAGHVVGTLAGRRSVATAPVRRPRPTVLPFISRCGPWSQIKASRLSGVYVLLRPSFLGGFIAGSWVLAMLLFCAIGSTPFIYFQF
jgi:hypothetical protein